MKKYPAYWRFLMSVAIAACLSACGGGGASPAPAPASPTPTTPSAESFQLSLTTATPSVTTYQGESADTVLTLSAGNTPPTYYYMRVVSDRGVVKSTFRTGTDFPQTFKVQVDELPVGVYPITLTVRLCKDAPDFCSKPLPPLTVTMQVEVKSRADAAERMVWTPNPVTLTAYEGESASFKVFGESADEIHFSNILTGGAELQSNLSDTSKPSGKSVIVAMSTLPGLPIGVHQTAVTVKMCLDRFGNCSEQIAGSPWTIPVEITVLPKTNLTPLTILPQLGAWNGWHGDPAGSGAIAASFDPSKFVRRWSIAQPAEALVAIDNGIIFSTPSNGTTGWDVQAQSELSGAVLWTTRGSTGPLTPPLAADGKLYTVESGSVAGIRAYQQANGQMLGTVALELPGETLTAPVLDQQDMLVATNKGLGKGVTSASGQPWSVTLPSWGLGYLASSADGYVVTSGDRALIVLSSATGALYWREPEVVGVVPGVAMDKQGKVYLIDRESHLSAFDLASKSRAWIAGGATPFVADGATPPAVANGVVYLASKTLTAFSALDGKLLWQTGLIPPTEQRGEAYLHLIVSNNLAFLSDLRRTIAVDLRTHKVVWSYPMGGTLSLSNRGILYIGGSRSLDAINLQ